jgi:hypothetical protein
MWKAKITLFKLEEGTILEYSVCWPRIRPFEMIDSFFLAEFNLFQLSIAFSKLLSSISHSKLALGGTPSCSLPAEPVSI